MFIQGLCRITRIYDPGLSGGGVTLESVTGALDCLAPVHADPPVHKPQCGYC